MKTEEREVVTKKIVYVAEDGMEFESEQLCMRHDEKILENKATETELAKYKIVELTDELYCFSCNEEERVFLCKIENENDVTLSAYALQKCGFVDKMEDVISEIKGEMNYNDNISFPFNVYISINYDVWATINYDKKLIKRINQIKEKLERF